MSDERKKLPPHPDNPENEPAISHGFPIIPQRGGRGHRRITAQEAASAREPAIFERLRAAVPPWEVERTARKKAEAEADWKWYSRRRLIFKVIEGGKAGEEKARRDRPELAGADYLEVIEGGGDGRPVWPGPGRPVSSYKKKEDA